jgi:hypothetical protein
MQLAGTLHCGGAGIRSAFLRWYTLKKRMRTTSGPKGKTEANLNISRRLLPCLLAFAVAAGCASTGILNRRILVDERLPRPGHIFVYDFAATDAEVPPNSSLAGAPTEDSPPQSAEQIAEGRRLGAEIASRLVEKIGAMGLPAERRSADSEPQVNDIVIRGYLLSVEEGTAAKRVAIGFRSGVSELRTAVEGYQMMPQGLRLLGFGEVHSRGGRTPGAAASLAVSLATRSPVSLLVGGVLKTYGETSGSARVEGRVEETAKEISDQLGKRFRELGWIK